MNNQVHELELRNKKLERRWKIAVALGVLAIVTRPIAFQLFNKYVRHEVALEFTREYPLLDPSRKFISQDRYVTNLDPLREKISEITGNPVNGLSELNFSMYYEQLNSGANISVNKDTDLYPASLSKLALAMVVADKIEDGEWKWSDELGHSEADLSSESGNFYKTIGTGPTKIEKLVEELLVNSDNTAQNILLHNINVDEEFKEIVSETGLEELYNDQGLVSAKEFSRLLRVLYTASYINRDDSQKLLDYLSRSTFRDYLSQGIPDGVKFAHKYGENKPQSIFADSGIVYADGKPYMITVLIRGKDSSEETRKWAVNIMKQVSEASYEFGK